MSAGPSTQTTCIHGSQSTREHDASHSTQHVALFYLFQEVSKLASPIHNTFLDTNSPPTWLKETSQQKSFMVKKEKEETHPCELSNSSCQHSLPHMMPHMNKVRDESHNSKIKTVESPPESNSPWKVLSLINLQCEKLLHHSDVEETDSGLALSATPVGHLVDKALAATANATDEEAGGDCLSFEFTFRPSLLMREKDHIPSSVLSGEDARDYNEEASTCKPECCVIDSKVIQLDTVRPELVEENATTKIKREDNFSVNRQFECKEDYLSSEQSSVTVTFENTFQIANIPLNGQLTFNSHTDRIIPMLKPELGLDYNANIALTKEPLSETRPRPSSQVALHLLSVKEVDHSLPRYSDIISASQLEDVHAPNDVNSPQKLSCCNAETNTPSSGELKQQEQIAPPSAHQWRTKTPRKQPHPSRSVDIQDPGFQGVTFRMDTELDDSKEQCRLLITSKYSEELCKSMRKPRVRARTSNKSVKSSSSDEESNPLTRVSKGKVCASCCTRKTPMWRDAEDGTPLCNACGIRYKKYRVRCFSCWHIPRKEGNSKSRCLKCGNFVRLTSAQRKHTT